MIKIKKPEDRFFAKVNKTNTCWLWVGSKCSSGYGNFFYNGKLHVASRWSYVHHKGPIPPDHEVDHLCRVRNCVKPEHLQTLTHKDNVRRTGRNNDAHCKRGHLFSEENTYNLNNNRGRSCRQCIRDQRGVKKAYGARKTKKITNDQAIDIIKAAHYGETGKQLSLKYGVSAPHIYTLLSGKARSNKKYPFLAKARKKYPYPHPKSPGRTPGVKKTTPMP